MSQLAFFPWMTLAGDVAVGQFRLIRYRRAKARGAGALHPDINNVLRTYHDHSGNPVNGATVLTLGERGLTDDLTERERIDLFAFAEIVAVAALSARRFFEQLEYCNRDQIRLIIQSFEGQGNGSALARLDAEMA